MSLEDKIKNAAQNIRGKAKEKAGEATGDKSLTADGRRDQTASDLKDAGESVKDALRD